MLVFLATTTLEMFSLQYSVLIFLSFGMLCLGHEANFEMISSENSTTHEVPYDYWSVMHYDKDAFSNGNSSTIITTDPAYQNVIGQKLGMSFRDVQELNLLYTCSKFYMYLFVF